MYLYIDTIEKGTGDGVRVSKSESERESEFRFYVTHLLKH